MIQALLFGGGRSLRNQRGLPLRNLYADSDRSILRSTSEHVDRGDGKIYGPLPRQFFGRNRAKKTKLRAAPVHRAHMP